jgi:hypothetical protein
VSHLPQFEGAVNRHTQDCGWIVNVFADASLWTLSFFPWSFSLCKKRIYRAAVSQRLGNTVWCIKLSIGALTAVRWTQTVPVIWDTVCEHSAVEVCTEERLWYHHQIIHWAWLVYRVIVKKGIETQSLFYWQNYSSRNVWTIQQNVNRGVYCSWNNLCTGCTFNLERYQTKQGCNESASLMEL